MSFLFPSIRYLPSIRKTPFRPLTMTSRPSVLVTPSWLRSQPSVTILDATWYKPTEQNNAYADFLYSHIPSARYFDIDGPGLCDPNSSLPHMLPTSENFACAASRLGVRDDIPVVIYARKGLVAASRAWWMFRVFGKNDVYLLDGGLEAWKRDGGETVGGHVENLQEGGFQVKMNPNLVSDMAKILNMVKEKEGTIIDARPKSRFHGTVPEFRKGLMSGHMPGAKSVPSSQLMEEDGTMKKKEQLKQIFEDAGVDLTTSSISLTCGSGVTATVLAVALHELGVDFAVYDGSWTEYGSFPNNPLETVHTTQN